MAWYLNRALSNFRNEVNARWPNRDKTSDGTIGDTAHQATNSDHNPDGDGSVDAWDMDVDGVDVQACINAAIQHESIQYIIYNRRITSRSWGLGSWRDYTGSNPHDKHVHFNTRSSHEASTKPWFVQEDDMPLTPDDATLVARTVHGQKLGSSTVSIGVALQETHAATKDLKTEVASVKQTVAALAAQPTNVTVTVDVSDPTVLKAIAKAVADELRGRLDA